MSHPPALDLGRTTLRFDGPPLIMGVLNATPDSFSDGGLHLDPERAIARGLAMLQEGADVLDIGGESTRPGAQAVDAQEELRRVLPVIQGLRRQAPRAALSIDTTKAQVAQAALRAGADIVNDVSGLLFDPRMASVIAEAGAAVVLMHTSGTPQDILQHTDYPDVVAQVEGHLQAAVQRAVLAGVDKAKIVVDAGLGFGKDVEDNLRLIRQSRRLHQATGCAVLVGPSRKRFLGQLTGVQEAHLRDWGTAGAVAAAALYGAHLVRVHEVGAMRQVLQVACAVQKISE